MKKLLSLLSVLTIGGSAMPGVIAVSFYEKQEKLNNNNLQTNNLEKLNRVEREIPDGLRTAMINSILENSESYNQEYFIYTKNNVKSSLFFIGLTSKKIFFWTSDKKLNLGKYGNIIILFEDNLGQVIKKIVINDNDSLKDIVNKYNLKEGISFKDNYKFKIYCAITNENIENDPNDYTDFYQTFKIENNIASRYLYSLEEVIKTTTIGNIINNSDEAILNELNYLNKNLNIHQLKIIEKDNISAKIKAKDDSGEYFGILKVHYNLNKENNKIIDLNKLIKKAIFIENREHIYNFNIEKIKSVNTNNLIYSNIEIKKLIEPTIDMYNESICSGKVILENNLSSEQKLRTPSCEYSIENITSSQITRGLSKTNVNQLGIDNGKTFSNTSSLTIGSENTNSNTSTLSNKIDVSSKGGINLTVVFEAGGSIGAGVELSSSDNNSRSNIKSSTNEIISSINNSFSKSVSVSNNFDLSNTNEIQNKKIYKLELPMQEINVGGNQSIQVDYFLGKVNAKIIVNLKQDIYGNVNYETIDYDDIKESFKISIKKIMEKLKQYNLLPDEITINKGDSITFNGKANILKQISTIGKIKISEIDTI